MNAIKTMHRWLGLGLAIVVMLVAATGVLLVWKKEYLWLSIPSARELPAENINLDEVVSRILNHYEQHEVLFTRFYYDELSIHKVWLDKRRYAYHDQYGEQIQVWSNNERFEDWLLDLHHRLLAGNSVGLNIVGFSGLLMIPLVLLGFVLWWSWRRSFSFSLFPKTSRLGHLRKTHAETGVTILLPLLVIVVSGVILVYPSESRWLLRDAFQEHPYEPLISKIQAVEENSELTDWAKALQRVKREFPEGKVKWMSLPSAESRGFAIGVQEAASWDRMGRSQIKFNGNEWLLVEQDRQGKAHQLIDFAYPLHTGKLPIWYRFFLSAVGMLLFWSCLIGIVVFFKRRSKLKQVY